MIKLKHLKNKKFLKTILQIVIVFAMIFSFASCSKVAKNNNFTSNQNYIEDTQLNKDNIFFSDKTINKNDISSDDKIINKDYITFDETLINKGRTLSDDKLNNKENNSFDDILLNKDGSYTSKEEVALYIYQYKKLPSNFITKNEAKKLGWGSDKKYVGDAAKGKSIGGDEFKNYEKVLPVIKGRKYYECDIDYEGKNRKAKRIVYADDFDEDIGFIYYTDDHYKTFERLY